MSDTETKTCMQCGEAKPLIEFIRNGRDKLGHQIYKPRCRGCSISDGIRNGLIVDRHAQIAKAREILTGCGLTKSRVAAYFTRTPA